MTIIFIYIATITQRVIYKSIKRKNYSKTPKLSHSFNFYLKRPQVKGVVSKVYSISPKKPNSANRHIAKVTLTNQLNALVRLPGQGSLCAKYNRLLVHGGRANDLPGVSYTAIRGQYDFSSVFGKKKRRSVYGVERPDGYTKYVRKKDRAIKA